MHIERISVEVPTRAPTGQTTCYILGRDDALLVDPPAADERIESKLDRIGHVAVTHHHHDHVGAVAEYAERTNATVWCRYGREEAFEEATGIEADRTVREDTEIPTGDGPVVVHETPGHAREHVAFEAGDSLVAGDLAIAVGSIVVGPSEGDMRAYLTSLRRVLAMAPDRIHPGHGPVIENPREACIRLINHRLDRERQVLAAVEDGNRTVDDVLDAAYEKNLSGVRDLAAATVRAHLAKLDHEKRIRWDGVHADPI